jgi:hypothetical protein
MQISILKLTTGEEVLGEVIEDNDNFITLKNPVGVAIVRGQNGQPSVGFAPFPLHMEQVKDRTFSFKQSMIVYSYTPQEEFINNYNQIFGSGIVLPNKQLITG